MYFRSEKFVFPRLVQFSLSIVFEIKELFISDISAFTLVDLSEHNNMFINLNDFFLIIYQFPELSFCYLLIWTIQHFKFGSL